MTEEYYHKKKSPTGYNTVCKECKKSYYESNREQKKEYQLRYAREKGIIKSYTQSVIQEKKLINIQDHINTKDGRIFTRLVGGFGEDKTIITTKQIAELMGYDNGIVTRTINRNIKSFQKGIDVIDIKEKTEVPTWHKENFLDIGYSQNAYNKAKNIYILSESGFLLYLKFAEGDRAVELYKDFIEDYFKTKVELKVAEVTIEKNINQLQDDKALLLGKIMMSNDEQDKMQMLIQIENINKVLQESKITLAKEETVKQFQDIITISDKFTNSKECYDIGLFSKILGIKRLGRNNMFKWMRDSKILRGNNEPYQSYMEHFKVIKVTKGNITTNKTVLKAGGIKYIVKRIIKDGYIKEKTYSEVIEILKDIQSEKIA